MVSNKNRMILDDHRRLCAELKEMRDRLVEITVRLSGGVELTDRIVITADRSWRAVDELRSAPYSFLFTNYPSVPGKELISIYFPSNDRQVNDRGR